LVGFAAETDDVIANASAKLTQKGLDLIVANDVSAPGVGFEHDTNQVTILGADDSRVDVAMTGKRQVARAVLDAVEARLDRNAKEQQ
jgi:phosphopantothenoylcysteine decarboxylase/phosphopantothenate--cysteine ligase